ncbi:ABC transporter ATP-binding protein [Halorubrum sp. Ib24]|uniref:ABC transporter ATP-binding protein n=1 Tax=unclassified Halorubrum TaxID=2642239 RepID=UPI000B9966DB|nr:MULTISPECIES: ABC transporter ATP-binding protein [unclassified Halorubrum]OYR41926.1 ABC transporter ATP-binding protein [Halorubrum sp. Hd13]OYR42539.1 ABC transporter ATP-binding protein [Halorubrum sp. Ib24]OYR44754.1 ABC transporter ATP-binding protein [Halorubrum sp. Eb13]OYR51384.1 ABC transporter ATP-binding protein [Halorubrum sp. Ea8]OYR52125.1 ABC transporter ATP-binding protein [Halorubrum sp. Ea1]
MSVLEFEGVHTYYGESHILQGLDLTVEDDEIVALVGRNGVGKTTTLRTALGLTPPRRGTVRFKGEDVTGREPHEIAGGGMGWVPEDRRVFAHLTVAENLRVAAHAAADPDARIGEAYDLFPALERFADKEAGDLSGGQQQMLAIARGMLGDNDLLLVDEPSEGLAPQIVSDVVEALRAASADTTMVLVEQNFRLAMDLADRFYLVDHGVVVEEGDTDGVTSEDERIRRYLTA